MHIIFGGGRGGPQANLTHDDLRAEQQQHLHIAKAAGVAFFLTPCAMGPPTRRCGSGEAGWR